MKIVKVDISFVPGDFWVGVYLKLERACKFCTYESREDMDSWLRHRNETYVHYLGVWICLVPMFPLHFGILFKGPTVTAKEYREALCK